jgi:phosphoglycerate dehydrogenase-like enzyme
MSTNGGARPPTLPFRTDEAAMRVTIAIDGFLQAGQMPAMPYDLDLVPCDDAVALARSLATATAVITRRADIGPALLSGAPHLALIQQVGVGTDRIDLAAAQHKGIAVANTPGAPAAAVAEYAFLLMLAAARDLHPQLEAVRHGGWSGPGVWEGTELGGSVVGIVGYGSIGRAVAKRALVFDSRVLVATRTVPPEAVDGIDFVSLGTLLRESDFVVLAPALTPETRGLIGPVELALMKPTAILVNVSRGAVLDESALVVALEAGRLRAAALDAFTVEPLTADSPLRSISRLIASPHIAGSTRQAKRRIWDQMLANLDRLANDKPLLNVVNGPPETNRQI